jgi:acyl-CoA thioester hydrolase
MQTPNAFEQVIGVEAADIDALGHVNNVVYVRWIQDIATAHWRALASPQAQAEVAWMVLRHEIDYKHPAILADEIILRTWVGTVAGLRFERHTEVLRRSDRKLLAQARTLWCPVDARTGRPRRVSEEVRKQFSMTSSA